MNLLHEIASIALRFPERIAATDTLEAMTYRQLWSASDLLAAKLDELLGADDLSPLVVYGHKSPLMIVCFLACAKSGRAYVPADVSVPDRRVFNIIDQVGSCLVLSAVEWEGGDVVFTSKESTQHLLGRDAIDDIIGPALCGDEIPAFPASRQVSGDDLFYLIFTSGSTGVPKGVMVTAGCVDAFYPWALSLAGAQSQQVVPFTFLNQAPFSFDLSVYELTMSLASGGTLLCLTAHHLGHMRLLFDVFARSEADVWVSTPSFATMCLADKSFDATLLPNLHTFIFCGESLSNQTAAKLLERFPRARVINSYGPTESTVAVSAVAITPDMAAAPQPLPVGFPRPGTRIDIIPFSEGEALEIGDVLPRGAVGEVLITGDTVAKGYWGREDLTAKAFSVGSVPEDGATTGDEREDVPPAGRVGGEVRSYRTGDRGQFDERGMLHYLGRIDSQVKMDGYRIELSEIQSQLERLRYVRAACVFPVVRNGSVSRLVAAIELDGDIALLGDTELAAKLHVKEDLKLVLPHYMVPRTITFIDEMPMTSNGKADHKRLAARFE